jgi:hypothetical protein
MKKKNATGSRIFSLWEKASKAKKIGATSTPNDTVGASTASHILPESNLQLALVQVTDTEREPESSDASPPPIVEEDKVIDEEDEST